MAHRSERVNSLIRREISELLRREVKDPRLGSFVAVTEVVTSPDMKNARVFVSRICEAARVEEEKQETLKALNSASGFLRRELARNLRLRHIPELSFEWDSSIERGEHLLSLIHEVCGEEGVNSTGTSDAGDSERK